MQIKFFGAAQTVTGSQHLLAVNGKNILIECGLFQGRREDTYEKNHTFPFDTSKIDAMVLSHAHIDHSGNIPNLVKNGYKGPIFATYPTVDLSAIMLRDTAHLQEKDVEWVNIKRRKLHQPPIEPLYDMSDVEKSLASFVGAHYDESIKITPDVTVTFQDAGHILGSACILFEIIENGHKTRMGFTGDLGRANMPILRDPQMLHDLDILITESTYGNRVHPPMEDMEEELAATVRELTESGGKIIIPAFAVGRTQLVVYILHKLFDQNRIPEIPIYVDSPLAREATDIFRHHPECFDRETQRVFLSNHEDPFGFKRLKYIQTVEESKALNDLKTPCIIISASGMAEGGRILHHLRNNIENPRNLILFVGYAAPDTLARKIMDVVKQPPVGGEKVVRIFGEEHTVRAKVKSMDYFSAHGDRNDLLHYAQATSPDKLRQIFLIHGEPDQAEPLRDTLKSAGYREVDIPKSGEGYKI